jgi:hypothetical protein
LEGKTVCYAVFRDVFHLTLFFVIQRHQFTKDEAAHIEGQKLKKKAEIARIEAARIKKLNHEIFTSRFTCHTSSGASAGYYAIDQLDNVTVGKKMLG